MTGQTYCSGPVLMQHIMAGSMWLSQEVKESKKKLGSHGLLQGHAPVTHEATPLTGCTIS